MKNSKQSRKSMHMLAAAVLGITLALVFSRVAGAEEHPFAYDDYAAVLESYVDDNGMVDYAALKANREKLDAFTTALEKLDRGAYEKWTDKQKIAFWINAYNGLTLQAIIDHYPIKASFIASLRFPRNSIRQIPGVWDELKFPVMGKEMTLDEIEHANLRRNFNEPRIHVALVCAALGCPPLRNEPFTGEFLDVQLDDQTRRFLENPEKFRIDRGGSRVDLSSIFKWFGNDFVETHGTEGQFSGHGESERAVLNFIGKYLHAKDLEYLSDGKYDIKYLDYDWSLNEQKRQ